MPLIPLRQLTINTQKRVIHSLVPSEGAQVLVVCRSKTWLEYTPLIVKVNEIVMTDRLHDTPKQSPLSNT